MSRVSYRGIATRTSIFAAVLMGALALLLGAGPCCAATITVTTASDCTGCGSLRDAVNTANGDTGDTINFNIPGTGPFTITLTSGHLVIMSSMSINGGTTQATGIIISQNQQDDIFDVQLGATLNIADLTLENGQGFGGAIQNRGMLTVTNCTFSNNSSQTDGTAIQTIGGTLTVTNSTFSGNVSDFPDVSAAAIFNQAGGPVTVTNCTFSGNYGGVRNGGGSFTLEASILASSLNHNCYGSITDGGYNISDDSTCGFGTSTGANGQTIGDNIANPGLSSSGLQANGGPTDTIALLSSSVAINAVPFASCPSTDQRGFPRPGEPAPVKACDVGAYEYQAIDCSTAAASTPNLISVPFVFYPESITGVSDPVGKFKISITDVEQRGPIINFPPLFCPNAQIVGSTAFVRASTQSLTGDMLYSIGFTATDRRRGASCTGSVPVCVQNLLNRGKPCSGTATYDATSCR